MSALTTLIESLTEARRCRGPFPLRCSASHWAAGEKSIAAPAPPTAAAPASFPRRALRSMLALRGGGLSGVPRFARRGAKVRAARGYSTVVRARLGVSHPAEPLPTNCPCGRPRCCCECNWVARGVQSLEMSTLVTKPRHLASYSSVSSSPEESIRFTCVTPKGKRISEDGAN